MASEEEDADEANLYNYFGQDSGADHGQLNVQRKFENERSIWPNQGLLCDSAIKRMKYSHEKLQDRSFEDYDEFDFQVRFLTAR